MLLTDCLKHYITQDRIISVKLYHGNKKLIFKDTASKILKQPDVKHWLVVSLNPDFEEETTSNFPDYNKPIVITVI